MQTDQHHDVVVIGGGPAGASAALECFDINLDTIVLEGRSTLGGQLGEIPNSIRNVAAGRFEDGPALEAELQRATAILDDRILTGHEVTEADLRAGWVKAGGGRFHAKALVIATGSVAQIFSAAPDGAFGGDVTYHVESRPDQFSGRDVVVVGGGDSATLDALELAATASSVKLVHRSEKLTARPDIVERVRQDRRIEDLSGWEVESVRGNEGLEGVVLLHPSTSERREVAAGGLVVKISRLPSTAVFRGQLELDRREAIVVDVALHTSQPGVFAAGDVVAGSYWRVATAFGQGVLTARSILRHLEAMQ
ncbi:MAG: NAD(P)/FAD-dependent oxidoreductase [Acidimicrobiales bacterium]|nr:NAD(P)/FAD-dependent oxidoreductase [Acidimicrobiales bacterium]